MLCAKLYASFFFFHFQIYLVIFTLVSVGSAWRVVMLNNAYFAGNCVLTFEGSGLNVLNQMESTCKFNDQASSVLIKGDSANDCFCFNENVDGSGLSKCWTYSGLIHNFEIDGIDKAVSVIAATDKNCIKTLHKAVQEHIPAVASCRTCTFLSGNSAKNNAEKYGPVSLLN